LVRRQNRSARHLWSTGEPESIVVTPLFDMVSLGVAAGSIGAHAS
jgi:hypothetical protein